MATPPFSCLRFVDVSTWDPSSPEWNQLLLQLPEHEQKQVTRFMFAKDQNLALGSRLLQRHLIHQLFGVNYDSIEIARTAENKPYWKRSGTVADASWNYNVSHHGTIVAIASDSRALVGVDVARVTDRPHRKTSIKDFFRAFAGHFNPNEWKYIRGEDSVDDDDSQYTRFYRLWSLKESYIKAIGIGLGFTLLRAEFVRKPPRWELLLDGQRASDWHFSCNQVNKEHLVSVAYGPFSAIWNPETSSIFQGGSISTIFPAATIGETEDWQEWRQQDLLQ